MIDPWDDMRFWVGIAFALGFLLGLVIGFNAP